MTYPPPPYKDAVCGQPVAGEAIVGTWWVYPSQPALQLGGVNPALVATVPGVVPSAGLGLGAALPVSLTVRPAVPSAGLGLGSYLPFLPDIASAPAGGLGLGATLPIFRVSQRANVLDAGLGLGAYLPKARQEWLDPIVPIDVPLTPIVCQRLVLTPVGCTDIPLEPAEVRR